MNTYQDTGFGGFSQPAPVVCPICKSTDTHVTGGRVIHGPDGSTLDRHLFCEQHHGIVVSYRSDHGCTEVVVSTTGLCPAESSDARFDLPPSLRGNV